MRMRIRLPIFLLLLSASLPAIAGEPVEGCVDLGPGHQAYRYGSQFVLVRDGESHYRLGVDDCGDLTISTRFAFDTEGTAGRLCASGTRVRLKNATCSASSLERIDAGTFARLRKRSR